MINWDALFLKLLNSRASGGQDDYAISILLYPISQILIVSRNIQPRVENQGESDKRHSQHWKEIMVTWSFLPFLTLTSMSGKYYNK